MVGHFTLSSPTITYDGTTKASDASGLTATVTLADGSTKQVDLTSADVTLLSPDGTSQGTYTYILSSAGRKAVQNELGSNYVLNDEKVGTITIVPAGLEATLNGTKFTYDGVTTASEATGLTATVNGKNVDLDSSDITITSDNDSSNAGSYTFTLNATGLAKVQNAAGGNYTVSLGADGTITIDKASVTITAPTVSKTYDGQAYTGDLTAKVEGKPAKGTDVVYSLTDVSKDINQGTYSIDVTATDADNPNYDITVASGGLTITKATTTADLSNTGFTYDGTTEASDAGLTATVNGTTVALDSSDITFTKGNDSSNAGSYTFTLNATGLAKVQNAAGGNYTVSLGADGTITIDKAAVTITAPTVSKIYDGSPYSGDITATVEGKPAKGADIVYSLTDVSKDINEGTYSIDVTATDADNPNYKISVVAGSLTVTAAKTSADLSNAKFTYDGTTKASEAPDLTATVTLSDGSTQVVSIDSSDIAITNDSVNAGEYTYSLNATGLAKVQDAVGKDYTVSQGKVGKVTIDKAAVTITAPTVSKMYDGSPYSGDITATVEGKPTDGAALVYSLTDVSQDVNQGTYPIDVTATDADNPNYDITVQSGKLTITAAQPALSLNQTSFTYDGKTKASEAAGLVATVTLVDGTKTTVDLDSSDVSIANDSVNVGNYVYTLSATGLTKVQAAVGNNYAVDDTNITGSVAIKAATANVSVNNGEFTYDGSTKASEAKNLVATVTLENGNSQTVDLTSDDIDVENDSTNAGSYTYQLTTAGIDKIQAAVGNNYVLNDTNVTGKVIIDKAKVTITAPTVSKTYDGKPYSDNLTATVSGQPVDGTNLVYSLTDVSKDIDQGTYPIDVLTNATDNSNYEVEVVNGSLTIAPAKATVSLSGNETETYTGAQQQPKASYYQVTLPNGQSYTLTDDDIALVSGGIEPGSYQVQLTDTGKQAIQQALGTDYEVSFTGAGTFVISSAAAKDVTTNSQTIHYGDATPDFTVTYGTGLTAASLTNDDFVFTNAKGQTITGVPTAVGVYSVTLNAAGIAKVEAANPDYTFTNANFIAGTFTILSQNNPGKPGNGGEPGGTTNPPTGNKPGQPTKPSQPENSGKNESNSVSTTKSTSVNNGSVKSISLTNANQTRTARYHANKLQNQKRLPQTSDSQGNPLTILGLSLMGMLLGLFGIRRKKDRF
ncbi:beta strand repeat-containing protein [Pediococcus ethanolidurans]|uniref:beta strand repeat-containing protein n=1 Tax=Pediococcus ethanolidurans TaxID=319653 RepID=UPI00345C050A